MRSFHAKEGYEEGMIIQKSVFLTGNGKKKVAITFIIVQITMNLKIDVLTVLTFLPISVHQCYPFRMGTKTHKFRPSVYHHIFFQGTRGILSIFSFWHASTDADSPPLRLYSHIWSLLNEGNEIWNPPVFLENRSKGMVILGVMHMQTHLWIHSLLHSWSWGIYPQWIHFYKICKS